jgi:O-antigen/teichoic acid export membrane protein
MVVAFLNYLYHPVLGRMMKIEDFGEVQAFISFTLIFGVFAGLFRNVIVHIAANYKGDAADKSAILMLQKLGLYFVIAISAVLLIFNGYFLNFFNFDSSYFFIVLSLLLVIGVFSSTHQAIVQGLHRFKVLSISGIIASATKIILAVILVYFGFNILGAISGLVLSSLIGLVYVYFYSNKHFPLGNGFKIAIDRRVKKELWYTFLVFAASFSITFLYTADTIIMKRYFTAEVAGFYSGIATIGRIIFFLTGSIAGVLLPSIKINDQEGENRRTLAKGIFLTGLLGGGALLTFSLFPDIITNLLIGKRYQAFAYLLPEVSVFLFIVSLANLVFFYLLALRSNFVIIAAAAGPLIVLGLTLIRHNTVGAIIDNFLMGSLAVLILLSGKIIVDFFKKNTYEKINLSSGSNLQ